MASFALRAATVRDLPLIYRGERSYIAEIEPEREQAWLAALDRNLELWIDNLPRTHVAVAAGTKAGYAIWRWADAEAEVVSIHALRQFRRQGVGAALLAACEIDAWNSGAQRLRLQVHVDNRARRLYERRGFRQVGIAGSQALYELLPPVNL